MHFLSLLRETMDGSALVDLKREGGRAVWDVKLHDSFAWTGQEIMTVRILGVGKWGKVKLQPWMSGQQHLAC